MNVNMTIGIGDGLLYSLLGLIVVFFALFLLMCIIKLMWVFEKKEQPAAPAAASATAAAPAPAAVPAPAPAAAPAPAPGCAGELKLYDTDDRTAAMIMAIVADETGIPINELRFKSIREVKD